MMKGLGIIAVLMLTGLIIDCVIVGFIMLVLSWSFEFALSLKHIIGVVIVMRIINGIIRSRKGDKQ